MRCCSVLRAAPADLLICKLRCFACCWILSSCFVAPPGDLEFWLVLCWVCQFAALGSGQRAQWRHPGYTTGFKALDLELASRLWSQHDDIAFFDQDPRAAEGR